MEQDNTGQHPPSSSNAAQCPPSVSNVVQNSHLDSNIPSSQQQLPLFPIILPPPLFPIIRGNVAPSASDASDSWLSNSSFDTSTLFVPSQPTVQLVPPLIVASPISTKLETNVHEHNSSNRHKSKKKKKIATTVAAHSQPPTQGVVRQQASGLWADSDHPSGWYFEGTGDRNNVAFGSLYRLDVPRFFRRVKRCVGLPGRVILQVNKTKGLTLVNQGDTKSTRAAPRYCLPQYALAQLRTDIKRLTVEQMRGPTKRVPATMEDFVPLETHYQSEIDEGETFEEFLHRRTGELNAATQKPGQTEKIWLEYIKFQDEFAKLGDRRTEGSLLEKKIAIYQKALELYPQSEELVIGYLSVCKSSWESSKVLALWEKILSHQGTDLAPRMSARLWREYIRFSTFNITLLRSTYSRAISILSRMKAGASLDPDSGVSVDDIDDFLISLVYRLCVAELQAGYTERAIGVLQALVEYNCFGPSIPRRADFLAFWDSEEPRIGDASSVGWGKWLQQQEEQRIQTAEAKRKLAEEERLRNYREETRKKREDIQVFTGDENWQEPKEDLIESFFQKLQKQLLEDHTLQNKPLDMTDDLSEDENTDAENMQDAPDSSSESETNEPMDVDEGKPAPNPEAHPLEQVPPDVLELRKRASKWLEHENKACTFKWQPLRPQSFDEEIEITDPECVILSEDIKDFMFLVGDDHKVTLVHRFLQFLGVPVPPVWPSSSQHHHDSVTSFVYVSQADIFSILLAESTRVDTNGQPEFKNSGDRSGLNWIWTTEWQVPTCGTTLLSVIKNQETLDFCRKATDLCVSVFPSETSICVGRLLLEIQSHSASSRTLAKSLLSNNRSDLRLWNLYAQTELAMGKPNEAYRVYETALSFALQLPQNARKDVWLLFRAYTQMLMQTEPKGSLLPLYIITSAADMKYTPVKKGQEVQVPPTDVLRARRLFAEHIQRVPGVPRAEHVDLVICFALFQYFTMGIESALAVYTETLKKFMPGSRLHESVQEHCCRLLYWHCATTSCSPAALRAVCASSVQQYPSNYLFLSMYVCMEQRAHMAFRLRAFFDDVLSHKKDPLLWMFALRTEELILKSPARVRALCERALMDADSQAVAGLWLYMFSFLTSRGDIKSAKQTFFRGVRHVPWSKAMWSMALQDPLVSQLTSAELRQIVGLIEEKGLRLHSNTPVMELEQDG